MRILQVVPVFSTPFGGPVTVVRLISEELAKRHEVVVYTTTALDSYHDFKPREIEVDGYKVAYFERTLKPLCYNGLFGTLGFSYSMLQAIKNNLRKFDVVHVHSWRQFPDALIHYYSKKYGVPYVLQVHGSLPRIMTKQLLKQFYDTTFGRAILRDASRVIALSHTEAKQYQQANVPKPKIAIVPNSINTSNYTTLPTKGSFRKKLKIQNYSKMLLYLGRIHKTKRIDLLIKAYGHLIKKFGLSDIELVIAGPDDGYLSEANFLAQSLGLSNSVHFTGFLQPSDKISALVDADVFITPSFYGFPMTFLESCVVGTPIVTTNLGDNLEWINGNVGLVTNPNESDLAHVISSILSDYDLRKKLSQKCVSYVDNNFSIKKIGKQLEAIYISVIKEN